MLKMDKEAKNKSEILVADKTESSASAQNPSKNKKEKQDEGQPPVWGLDQGQGQNQNPGQTLEQREYEQKTGFNPCKCCCAGNLRQACFAIAMVEIGVFVWTVISLLYTILALQMGRGVGNNKNTTTNSATPATSTSNIVSFVTFSLSAVLVIAAFTSMLIATAKRSKAACLVHSVFAILIALYFLSLFILAIVQLVTGVSDSASDRSTVTSTYSGLLVIRLVMSGLFAYFSANSAGLYSKYKKGVTYPNTPVCSCNCFGRRVSPYGYRNGYGYGGYGYGPPPPQVIIIQVPGQSQGQGQIENTSQNLAPEDKSNSNKQTPPPAYSK